MNNSLIYELDYSHILTPKFCDHLIDKFESDNRKGVGAVGTGGKPKLDVKTSVDLNIAYHIEEYHNETTRLMRLLNTVLQDYYLYVKDEVHEQVFPFYDTAPGELHSGFQIQRTDPGGFYTWHSDEHSYTRTDYNLEITTTFYRGLTYIFYLNDVKEDGYTEFIDGTKIQPEQGKALVFPATWTYLHRGFPPKSETKYIATGWLYGKKLSSSSTPSPTLFPGAKYAVTDPTML